MTDKLQEHKTTPMDFVRIILEHKTAIINRTDILELLSEANMEDVGGLDLLKEWIEKRRPAMTSQKAVDFGLDQPRGLLLVGPPGTGKSLTAKAIPGLLGVTGIKFDLSRVFAGLVGKSEERIRMALAQIDAMAPCVALIDDIDKGMGGVANGGGGDSGTSMRVLGTVLTWMQDRVGPPTPVQIQTPNSRPYFRRW